MKAIKIQSILVSICLMIFAGCTFKKPELGSEKNPVKLYFVPSVDAKLIEDGSKEIKAYLQKTTGYAFDVSIPQSYIAVVEAFGSKKADVSFINTFGYLLANQKYGAEARLTVLRHGSATYQAMLVVKEGSKVKSVEDLNGKKVAFVDPASTSGYLLPKKILADKGIKPKEEVFAMKHDSVITMVYQGQVDAGAAFYSPAADNEIQDARRLVKTQYPDVEKKIKILQLSDAIPNDPIIFRADLTEEMKTKISDSLKAYIQTPEGKDVLKKIYGIDNLKTATNADYDVVRDMLKSLGKSADDLVKK